MSTRRRAPAVTRMGRSVSLPVSGEAIDRAPVFAWGSAGAAAQTTLLSSPAASGRGGVPANASAVTGNLTVVDETSSWAIYLGPDPIASPTSSTLNFVKGDTLANGLTVALSAAGTPSATYRRAPGLPPISSST
jgi:hypothetical protein